MMKKMVSLPLKLNHAKAYAANKARVIGKTTAGIVRAKLLKKNWARGGLVVDPWKST